MHGFGAVAQQYYSRASFVTCDKIQDGDVLAVALHSAKA